MNVDSAAIEELFRLHYIESLISSGAPEDEYDPEAERIVAALEALPRELVSATQNESRMNPERIQNCPRGSASTRQRI